MNYYVSKYLIETTFISIIRVVVLTSRTFLLERLRGGIVQKYNIMSKYLAPLNQ